MAGRSYKPVLIDRRPGAALSAAESRGGGGGGVLAAESLRAGFCPKIVYNIVGAFKEPIHYMYLYTIAIASH
jgi:hypothetical protein